MFFLIFLAVAVKKVFILIFTTPDGLLVEFRNSRLSSRFSLLLKTDGFYSENRWIFPQYYQSRRRKSKHQRIDRGNEVRIQKLRAWNYFSSASLISYSIAFFISAGDCEGGVKVPQPIKISSLPMNYPYIPNASLN